MGQGALLAWLRAWLRRLFGSPGVPAPGPGGRPPEDEGDAAQPAGAAPVYTLRDEFLSRAEASFFHVLRGVAAEHYLIFAKVRLADLIQAPRQVGQHAAFQRISRKHVDFVLCHPQTLRPVAALELDDRSHQRPDRAARDDFVDRLFAGVGLPLLRVPVQRAYQTRTLAALLAEAIPGYPPSAAAPGAGQTFAEHAPAPSSPPTARTCERCGAPMRLRRVAQGAHAGQAFWGCTNYPRCRNTVAA